MKKQVTCIGCPLGCTVAVIFSDDEEIIDVTGNTCKRGDDYARKELTNPSRVLTTLVRILNGDVNMLSVKTASDIPKGKIFDCVEAVRDLTVMAPVAIGDIILENICDTGVNLIATKDVKKIDSEAGEK